MIEEIRFPDDPENYVFTLKPRFASVYLLARAKQYYGSLDGLDIVDYTDFKSLEHFERKKFQYMEICQLADAIGIPHLKIIWWEKLFPDTYRTVRGDGIDRIEVTEAFVRLLKAIDPSTEGLLDGGSVSSSSALKRMALLRYANIIDDQLEFNTASNKWKTIAAWDAVSLRGPQNDPSRQTVTGVVQTANQYMIPEAGRPLVWAPLANYTVVEIITEARKYGVLDALMQTNVCQSHSRTGRPGYCGVCKHCLVRRHSFIQADVEDTTKYDAT